MVISRSSLARLVIALVLTLRPSKSLILKGKQLEGKNVGKNTVQGLSMSDIVQQSLAQQNNNPFQSPDYREYRAPIHYRDEASRNVSLLLDSFLEGYDKRLRPNYRGPPVEVGVTMWVQSVSSISEVDMDFTVEMYFRQYWRDPRLQFDQMEEELAISAEMLERIWWPDTFFANAKSAQFHTATTKNVFLRIDSEGNVLCSLRLTVTAACPMDLTYFPMDSQTCTLEIESFGYTISDIVYNWVKDQTPVGISGDVELPQFRIIDYGTVTRTIELSTGNYSRLGCKMLFERSMGYYLIQIYIPSTLIVVLSWISFWLSRSAVPARVALGITTVLTMTTLISSTNASLPKISYLKSIDVYLVTCFIMVFASLLEYAAVSYITKQSQCNTSTSNHHDDGGPKVIHHHRADSVLVFENECQLARRLTVPHSRTFSHMEDIHNGNIWRRKSSNLKCAVPMEVHLKSGNFQQTECNLHSDFQRRESSREPADFRRNSRDPRRESTRGDLGPGDEEGQPLSRDCSTSCRECCTIKPSTIDKHSRVMFPLVFICFNILYWVTYLYISVNTGDRSNFHSTVN